MKKTSNILILFLFYAAFSFGQMQEYDFKMKVEKTTDQWHTIQLPDALFGKVTQNLRDIRIFGVTAKNDTIEAPYILDIPQEGPEITTITMETLNTSKKNGVYYFTFKIPVKSTINQMNLKFSEKNYDWMLRLEGSHDQKEWFNIVEDYRILSIKNEQTNYSFGDVTFPNSNYSYYRIGVKAKKQPKLIAATLNHRTIVEADYIQRRFTKTNITEDKNQTIITAELDKPLPISSIKIDVGDKIDFYRRVKIEYLQDSIKTEKGYKEIYNTLGFLTISKERNTFNTVNTIAQKLRFRILNNDDEPLEDIKVSAKSLKHHLKVRFNKPADYYLVYGNKTVTYPNYDIAKLNPELPEDIKNLDLGMEEIIPKIQPETNTPLFEDKKWLWGIMAVIIVILGWFSFKMMKEKG